MHLKLIGIFFALVFPLTVVADICGTPNESTPTSYKLEWSSVSLGSGLGASGFSTFDSDNDGLTEILFGTGAGFGGNTSFAVIEYDVSAADYKILCQASAYSAGIKKIISFQNSAISQGSLVALGDGSIEVIDHSLGFKAQLIPTGQTQINDILLGDIDNDGVDEIAVLTNSIIRIYDANTYAFEQDLNYGARSFALGKFTDQTGVEIALNTGLVLELNASTVDVLWDYTTIGFSNLFLKSGDIDNDGLDEIVAADGWTSMRTFNADLMGILWEHSTSHDIAALRVFDTNGDNIPEVVYGDGQWGDTHGLDGSTGSQLWFVDNPEHGVTDIFVGDLDGDAGIELLWGAGFSSTGPDYLFIHDLNTDLREWQSGENSGPYYAVAYGDLDGDGIADRVYASFESESGYGDGIVTAVKSGTGEVLWETTANTFNSNAWTGVHDVTVADVDGDGVNEVIVGTDKLYTGYVYILSAVDGSVKNSVALESGSPIYSVRVVDIDGDGDNEILAGGGKEHTGATGVYVYVIDGPTSTWVSTFPSLGNNWTDLWAIEPVDIDNDGTLEIIAVWDNTFIIDPDTNGLVATTDTYGSVAHSVDVFTGDNIAYVGGLDGAIYRLFSDGSVEFKDTVCAGEVRALETISPVKLAFTCGGRLGTYDVVGGTVEWQTSVLLDTQLGFYDRLVHQSISGKHTLFVGGSRAYYFVEGSTVGGSTPIANNASYSSHFNQQIIGVLSASDPDSAPLVYGIYQQPTSGTVEITNSTTGEFRYTPSGNLVGQDSFQFYVSNGSVASNLATVNLTLTNTRPAGTNSTDSVHWTSLYYGQLSGADADADTIRFEFVSNSSSGVLVMLDENTGDYTFYNTSNAVDSVSFSYRITDGAEWSDTYFVTLQLTNTIPVATNINLETYYAIDVSTLIIAQDDDGDTLSYELIGQPAIGTATLISNGLLTYSTTSTDSYQVVIAYRVFDGKHWSPPGELTINVIGSIVPGYSPVYITNFSASTYVGIGPLGVDFTLLVAGGSASYVYEWDFGDGNLSSSQSPTHTFVEPGHYSVSVRISDVNDPFNIAMGYVDVLVISSPEELTINLAVTENSDGNPLHIDMMTTISGGSAPYTINIDYGDGTTEEIVVNTANAEVSHIYQTSGIYNISMVVTSSNSAGANLVTLSSRQVSVSTDTVASSSNGGGGSFGLWMLLLLFIRYVPGIRTA